MRIIVTALLAFAAAALLTPVIAEAEENTKRVGPAYRTFQPSSPGPRLCEFACEADRRCLSWNYTRNPFVSEENGRCVLIDRPIAPAEDPCCASGAKDITPGLFRKFGNWTTFEDDTDYPGHDIERNVMATGGTARECQRQCLNDGACFGFTYVNPGFQERAPVCYLKGPVLGNPAARQEIRRANPCCTSGIKRRFTPVRSTPDDQDGDGLPDDWERDNAALGVSPDRTDFILVVVKYPDAVYNETLDFNLDFVKAFFKSIPVSYEDGNERPISTGINVIVQPGNELDDSFSVNAVPLRDYREAYEPGMPDSLKGYAHGLYIYPTGSGGQANRADWAGLGNSWKTMVHELGHQLGLGHEPLSNGVRSPLYTSLMNYDYSGSFNGDPYAIHFSRGLFQTMEIDEQRLSEKLPYPENRLQFLTENPYRYLVEALDDKMTAVDFNRNGIAGEEDISADINDGYAVGTIHVQPPGLSSIVVTGQLATASIGDTLVAFHADIPSFIPGARGAFPGGGLILTGTYAGEGASPDRPTRLKYVTVQEGEIRQTGVALEEFTLTGQPDAVAFDTGLVLTVAPGGGTNRFMLMVHRLTESGALTEVARRTYTAPPSDISAVKTPRGTYVLLRNQETGRVSARRVTSLSPLRLGNADDLGLVSNSHPAAVWNSKTGRLVVLSTRATDNRLWMTGIQAQRPDRQRQCVAGTRREAPGWQARDHK